MNSNIASMLDVLDSDLIQVLKELEDKDEQLLNRSPKEGAWSVAQILNHLKLAEHYTLIYIQKKINANGLKKSPFSSRLRLILLKSYLKSPLTFAAPKGVDTSSLPAHDTIENIKTEWLNQRKALREFLNDLSEEQIQLSVYKHPAAGRFSFKDMISFLSSHFRHHRKQIIRTLKEVEEEG